MRKSKFFFIFVIAAFITSIVPLYAYKPTYPEIKSCLKENPVYSHRYINTSQIKTSEPKHLTFKIFKNRLQKPIIKFPTNDRVLRKFLDNLIKFITSL